MIKHNKLRTKRLIIIAKNILIASACAIRKSADTIRKSADTIRMSANILIVFLRSTTSLKNKELQTNKTTKRAATKSAMTRSRNVLRKGKTKRDRPQRAIAFEQNILQWGLNSLNSELSLLDVGSNNHNII